MFKFITAIVFAGLMVLSSPLQASVVEVTFSGTIDNVPPELASNWFFEVGSHVSWTITVNNEPLNIGETIARYSGDYPSQLALGNFSSAPNFSNARAYVDLLGENRLSSGVQLFPAQISDELYITVAGVILRDTTQTAFGQSLLDTPLTDLLDLGAFDIAQFRLGFISLPDDPPDIEIEMYVNITDITFRPVPVPAAIWFLLSGLLCLTWVRKSK